MKINFFIFAALVVLTPLWLSGQIYDLPMESDPFIPLNDARDKILTQKLKSDLNRDPYLKNLIKKKKMAVSLVDLQRPEKPVYAEINGNHMMYAASLPKIAILLATLDAIDKNEIQHTAEVEKLMSDMIRVSSNTASTQLIDMLGYERIARVLQDKKYNLYNAKGFGGLWVGKRYAARGKKYPDPIKGLSHAATANQVARFYYMLAYGKLINCSRSEQMLSYLKDPGLHHKFVYSLDRVAPEAEVYRKSGTWRDYHADSVLVTEGDKRNYILVALIEDKNGEQIMRNLVGKVEGLLHPQPATFAVTAE